MPATHCTATSRFLASFPGKLCGKILNFPGSEPSHSVAAGRMRPLVGRPCGTTCGTTLWLPKKPRRAEVQQSTFVIRSLLYRSSRVTICDISNFPYELSQSRSWKDEILRWTQCLTQTGRRWTYHVVPNSSHVLLIAYVFGPRHVCRPARPRAAPPARSAGDQPTPTRSDHQAAAVQGRRRSTSGDGGGQKRPHNSPFDASPRAAATVRPERARGLGLSGWVDRVTRESGTLSRRKG